MTAATDGKFLPAIARERDNASDVAGICYTHNDGWAAIYPAIENSSGLVIFGVARPNNGAFDTSAKPVA